MQLTLLSLTTLAVLSIVTARDVSLKLDNGSLHRKLDSSKNGMQKAGADDVDGSDFWNRELRSSYGGGSKSRFYHSKHGKKKKSKSKKHKHSHSRRELVSAEEGSVDFWERELKHSSHGHKKSKKHHSKSKKGHKHSASKKSRKYNRRELVDLEGDMLEFWDRELKHSSHGHKKSKKHHSKSKKHKHKHSASKKSRKYNRRELVEEKDSVVDYWDREFDDSEEFEVSGDTASTDSIGELNEAAEFWERELKHSSHKHSKKHSKSKKGKHHKKHNKSRKYSRRALFDETDASEFWERELKHSSRSHNKHSKKHSKSKKGGKHHKKHGKSYKYSRRMLTLDELDMKDSFEGDFAAPLSIIDERQNTPRGHVRRR